MMKNRELELKTIWDKLSAEVQRMHRENDTNGTKRDQLIKEVQMYYMNRTWTGSEDDVKAAKKGLRNSMVEPSDK